MMQRSGVGGKALAAAVAMLLAHAVAGAPYTPTDDAQVLERLPERTAPQYRELKRLQAIATAAPGDARSAVALANAYYQLSRAEGDPRYLGYAQAALAPWWKEPDASTPVLIARATILQSNHEFDRALADLGKALAREPANGRALMVRASVLTVLGRFPEARSDCAKLSGVVAELYVVACVASIDSLGRQVRRGRGVDRALPRLAACRRHRRARLRRVAAR